MRTRKCAIIVGGCLGLLFFGLLLMDWTYLIFITPLLILLFFGVILFSSSDPSIGVVRTLSNVKIFEDDKIEVTLQLVNRGRNIRILEIFDSLPSKVAITKGSKYAVINMKKNEEVSIS